MRWRKVSLIGVGLLGGSLGLALRKRVLRTRFLDSSVANGVLRNVLAKGAVDLATLDPVEAVTGADLVIFFYPLAQMADLATTIAPHLHKDVIVTDVGSVKAALVEELLLFSSHTKSSYR